LWGEQVVTGMRPDLVEMFVSVKEFFKEGKRKSM
jgi:hypothetical protein